MIRFVDIRGQGTGYRFAFWDTTRSHFCAFCDEQGWTDKADFEEAFRSAGGLFADAVRVSGIERFTELMPEWAALPMGEDEAP